MDHAENGEMGDGWLSVIGYSGVALFPLLCVYRRCRPLSLVLVCRRMWFCASRFCAGTNPILLSLRNTTKKDLRLGSE